MSEQENSPESSPKKLAVLVDDEEENLFVFKRRFASALKFKTFTDPREALEFVKMTPEVRLVVTDQSMPHLSGLQLACEIRKVKPEMRFIMITGNPDGESDLRYNALSSNRFFDFLNKPLNLEHQGEVILSMMKKAMSY